MKDRLRCRPLADNFDSSEFFDVARCGDWILIVFELLSLSASSVGGCCFWADLIGRGILLPALRNSPCRDSVLESEKTDNWACELSDRGWETQSSDSESSQACDMILKGAVVIQEWVQFISKSIRDKDFAPS